MNINSKVCGDYWQGAIVDDDPIKVRGLVNGYAWYFCLNNKNCSLEIAEDQDISNSQLPLVGFGCAGWLFEKSLNSDEILSLEKTENLEAFLNDVLLSFSQNKLEYIPSVICSCSD